MNSVSVEVVTDLVEAKTLIATKREPFILRGFDIGECTRKWSNSNYLPETVNQNKQVRVHVSPVNDMNFIKKNFVYRSLPFQEFIRRASNETNTEFFIAPDEKYYLRSVGDDERKDVSDIK